LVGIIIILTLISVSGWGSTADEAESDSPTHIIIDSVYINNQNIFDLDSSKYDFWPFHLANRFHIKTKKYVIRRELLLREGDVYSQELADETERNLRALPFLWDAHLKMAQTPGGKNILYATTADSWTLLGGFSLNRSAGETVYHIRAEEQNFLGTGQYLSFHYYIRDTLDDYGQFTYLERRLFSSRLYFQIYHDGNPEVGITSLSMGKPYFSMDSRYRGRFDYIDWDRRHDYYDNGVIVARDKTEGLQLIYSGGYRFGSYYNKVEFGAELIYKDLNVIDKAYLDPHGGMTLPQDSLYYAVIPSFAILNYQYISTTHIDNFRRVEDILLLNGARLRLGQFIDRDGKKLYDFAGFTVDYSKYFDHNMIFLKFNRNYWFNGRRDFRKSSVFSIRYYNNAISWLTSLVNVSYNEDIREDNNASLYLGENNGLRGYPKNYSTGEKRIMANVEWRLFPGIEFLSVDLGAVQFVDIGKSWNRDVDLRLEDILWSAGVGLRFGLERVSSAKIMRFDLAYAGQLKEWQLSFGLGHYLK